MNSSRVDHPHNSETIIGGEQGVGEIVDVFQRLLSKPVVVCRFKDADFDKTWTSTSNDQGWRLFIALRYEALLRCGGESAEALTVPEGGAVLLPLSQDFLSEGDGLIVVSRARTLRVSLVGSRRAYLVRECAQGSEHRRELGAFSRMLRRPIAVRDCTRRGREGALIAGMLAVIAELIERPASGTLKERAGTRNLFFNLTAIISENISSSLSVSTAAKELGVSPQYVNRICHRFRGRTFTQLLRFRRLETARHLLLDGDILVRDVAAACGYQDPDYFIQLFRRQFGISPLQFRKAISRKRPCSEDLCRLHQTSGFRELTALSGGDALLSMSTAAGHNMLMLCNLLDEPVVLEWVNAVGEMEFEAVVEPDQRHMVGTAAGQCWLIRASDQQLIAAYRTAHEAGIILLTHDADLRRTSGA